MDTGKWKSPVTLLVAVATWVITLFPPPTLATNLVSFDEEHPSLNLVSGSAGAATIIDGEGELVISTPPTPDIAHASLSNDVLTIDPIAAGRSSLAITDSSTPPRTILIELVVAAPTGDPDGQLDRAGRALSGTTTDASFDIDISTDGGVTLTPLRSFSTTDTLDITAVAHIDSRDVGREGELITVAMVDDRWYMRDGVHWSPWDGDIASLTAINAPRRLAETETIEVAGGLTGLSGDFLVFVGYRHELDFIYRPIPLGFTVNP